MFISPDIYQHFEAICSQVLKEGKNKFSDIPELFDGMSELIKRGGKRIRPLLFLYLIQEFNQYSEPELKEKKHIFHLAAYIEIIHNATLIVDDIEDQSNQRRHQPSIHLLWGLDTSINNANYFYFYLHQIQKEKIWSHKQKYLFYSTYIHALHDLHIGQALDIFFHKNILIPSYAHYQKLVRYKTATLFILSAQWASIVSQHNYPSIWTKYLYQLGILFQMKDDVYNLQSLSLGKNKDDDIKEKKKSFPLILYQNLHTPQETYKLCQKLHRSSESDQAEVRESLLALIPRMKKYIQKKEAKLMAELNKEKEGKIWINIMSSILTELKDS